MPSLDVLRQIELPEVSANAFSLYRVTRLLERVEREDKTRMNVSQRRFLSCLTRDTAFEKLAIDVDESIRIHSRVL